VAAAGNWIVVVRDTVAGRAVEAAATIAVRDHQVAAVGSAALSEKTPVATTETDAAKIDTRQPPTPMHYISLDDALRNGKPTVLVFATPQLCETRLCGPVVDEVLAVYGRVGVARANFVDVEIYPTRDSHNPAPEFLRWGFQSEPWVLVIDRNGVIRARFEGPSNAAEIQSALNPLLAPA
jgi:cytochrome oxidase Cu insertion factor (SCO1/SenC/PrrC family)